MRPRPPRGCAAPPPVVSCAASAPPPADNARRQRASAAAAHRAPRLSSSTWATLQSRTAARRTTDRSLERRPPRRCRRPCGQVCRAADPPFPPPPPPPQLVQCHRASCGQAWLGRTRGAASAGARAATVHQPAQHDAPRHALCVRLHRSPQAGAALPRRAHVRGGLLERICRARHSGPRQF